ncbi:hypothetical protein X943_000550 [Babesia divergens]|uniref:Serine--tRNA ligase n=1 Tax=Babesia divergens TaxID=32595 RepID=A0AAD9GFF9_BABDI|nr:hypothetical protein X943_000550 [Babesia divergens]
MYITATFLLLLLDFISLSTEGRHGYRKGTCCLQTIGFLRKEASLLPGTQRYVRATASEVSDTANSGSEESDEYCKSSDYERLCHYFSDAEKRVDAEIFAPLKGSVVRRKVGCDGFIPNSFDLDALGIVPELFHENFSLRNENHWGALMHIRALYLEKRAAEQEFESVSLRRSELAKSYHASSEAEKASLRATNLSIRNEAKSIELRIKHLNEQIQLLVETLPNIVSEDVPPTEPLVEETFPDHQPPEIPATIVPHYKVLKHFSHPCTTKSTEISGTGFSAFSGDVSRLERALVNFMLDTHYKLFGYTEVSVPLIVSQSTVKVTGHLPRFEEDLFKLDERHRSNGDCAYLIPTGEIPLLALFGNARIPRSKLPVWLMAHTPCFRSEIQDYGRQTRGLIRNHQFGKVELICLCDSERSDRFHSLMISHIEYILRALELPYRRVLLPAEQLGTTSSKTVDFEVFFPSLNNYIEVSSCSNTRDYQSTRLNLFTRPRAKVHCINGSGLAIGRTLSAILENYQSLDSNSNLEIRVPKVLQPYLDGQKTIRRPVPQC